MKYVMAVLFTIFCAAAAFAEPGYREVRSGNSAFGKGDFTSAVGSYQKAGEKNPSQAAIDYDLGTAYYKAGEYDKAVESLQKGLLSDDVKVVNKAHFNLGNALYKAGTAREDKDISGAIKSLESALPHYEKVIAQDPKDTAAPANKDFVKKEIERLKKKQQEQKQQQKKDQSSSSGQSGQEGQSGQQDQKQQDQKQQDQQGSQSQGQQQDQGQKQDEKQDQPQAGQGSDSDQKKDQEENAGKPQGSQEAPSQGQDQKGSSSPEKDSASSGQAAQGQILSQKEAKTLLDDFDQNEQPKGLLNFIQRQGNDRPVEKDW